MLRVGWHVDLVLRATRSFALSLPFAEFPRRTAPLSLPAADGRCVARAAECRGWDVNEVVFSDQMWEIYEGLMRADFT